MHTRANNIHSKPTRQVGFVLKAHGYKGHLKLNLEDGFAPHEFLLLGINEKFVPYKIESYSAESFIVKLEGYDKIESAAELIGFPVLDFSEEINQEDQELVGYTLIDLKSNREYVISAIVVYPGNRMLEFRDGYKDFLLPLHPDLVKKVDKKKKIVSAEFPDGLLDL